MSQYLFSYGTLQPEMAPAEIAPVVCRLELVGEASVRGTLYDFQDFPGIVLDSSSKENVFGRVYKLPADERVLRQIDDYEEFDPNAPEDSLFVRTLHAIQLATGEELKCWIYVYNQNLGQSPMLEGGSFQKRAS